MKEFLVNGFFYLAVAALITLILLPILYSRALRRREKNVSLRQFILRDPDLRQGILEEHQKQGGKTAPTRKE